MTMRMPPPLTYEVVVQVPRENWDRLPASVRNPERVQIIVSGSRAIFEVAHRPLTKAGTEPKRRTYQSFLMNEDKAERWISILLGRAPEAEIVKKALPWEIRKTREYRQRRDERMGLSD